MANQAQAQQMMVSATDVAVEITWSTLKGESYCAEGDAGR